MSHTLQVEQLAGTGESHRILRLQGALVLSTLPHLQPLILEDVTPLLILDMAGVTVIDSAGIGTIVGAHIARQKTDRRLAVVGMTERIRAQFRIAHLDEVLTLFAGANDAIAALAPRS